eukprot:TRINITY_DN15245_c0_g1_i1.p1 TRINITY_DN15245_c0_g1~~TRINITY_DN15245_c0_g1_i1.p1  ORF type:complete len:595 (+),score=237.23 TRINITY_DN15245_c0_g1_i1:94-1878(+)
MDITQTIVQEIVSQCGRHGFVVSASLARFFLEAQLLGDEKDGVAVELAPERIEALVDVSVRKLTESDSPSLETFKLQASVMTMKQDQINRNRTEDVQHRAKAHQLMQEVCSKSDPQQVFGDMTLYVLQEMHLFNSQNDLVQKETMTALESVIPRGSIAPFIAQKADDKMKQLEELWRIVWGIRLFNKETHKGGAGIPNLPVDTKQTLETCQLAVRQNMSVGDKAANHYQAVLTTPSIQLTPEERQRLIDEYINRKQFLVYLRNLSELFEASSKRFAALHPEWTVLVEDVRAMVSQSASIPKSTIYPKFIDLSERWDTFRELWRNVSDCKKLLDLVIAYQSPFHATLKPQDVESALLARAEELTPNKLLIQGEVQNPAVNYLMELPPDRPLEFNGFCVASLMDEGLLLDGKTGPKSPGFVHLVANDTLYAFSSERLLKSFARDPLRYLSQALIDTVAGQPELIHLLGLQNQLPKEIYLLGQRTSTRPREIVRVDGSTQTGQIDPYKDHKYQWNEWELRRLALKLANLRSKRTHSSQTTLSHMRRDNGAQTFAPKEVETQTLQDKSTQPTRKVQYIKGLRGHSNQTPQVVQLEFDQ